MDGSTWIALVEQYVHAINEGAVPDIQSSWAYICRQKAQQALNECKEQFDMDIQDNLTLPMHTTEIENIVNDIKYGVMQKFSKTCKGEPEIV